MSAARITELESEVATLRQALMDEADNNTQLRAERARLIAIIKRSHSDPRDSDAVAAILMEK